MVRHSSKNAKRSWKRTWKGGEELDFSLSNLDAFQGTNISHHVKRNIIFKSAFKRGYIYIYVSSQEGNYGESTNVPMMTQVADNWINWGLWPPWPGCNRDHQDFVTFLTGNPNQNLNLPLLLGGGHTQLIIITSWKFYSSPLNISHHPKRKGSSSNHHFSGATLPETNVAHENPIFPGKYHQNGGFSMAMLVYRRLCLTSRV